MPGFASDNKGYVLTLPLAPVRAGEVSHASSVASA
jgi:hypothetical protein